MGFIGRYFRRFQRKHQTGAAITRSGIVIVAFAGAFSPGWTRRRLGP
jgi:hypothetical protein